MSAITQAITQTNNEFNQALSKQTGSTLDKDSFMLLLVTQFKYQDPLNPMDDKEFISQMAQFSSLEQMMNMNESMEGLTEATNNQTLINATSYIGKQVSVAGNTIGKVTDATGVSTISTFRYAFGDNVTKGTLSVKDGNGNTIYTEDLAGKQAGVTFEFNWDGKNGAGLPADDGVYTVTLSAFNSSGEAVLSDQVVDATVTGLVNQNGSVYLGMDGGQLLELSNIRQVTLPKTVANAPLNPDEGSNDSEGGVGEGSTEAGDSSAGAEGDSSVAEGDTENPENTGNEDAANGAA
ncbi:MAG: flagellar hook assembly protein FlgD [Desulfovibrio sp.]|nr:flagellar hook assembly protein FlgD [Desulfovibrio sp.]